MERLISEIVRKVSVPLLERAGAYFALVFIAQGVDPHLVDQTTVALVAGAGMLTDVLVSAYFRRKGKKSDA